MTTHDNGAYVKAIADALEAVSERNHEFFVGNPRDPSFSPRLRENALLQEVYDRAFREGFQAGQEYVAGGCG